MVKSSNIGCGRNGGKIPKEERRLAEKEARENYKFI